MVKKDKNTPFECSGQILYNWSENDWTKRLVTGLQKMLPNHKHLANLGISGSTSNDSSSEEELIENSLPNVIHF